MMMRLKNTFADGLLHHWCRFGRKKTVVVHMVAAAISAVCVSFIPAGTDNKGDYCLILGFL